MSRIAQLSDLINQKNSLFQRAEIISGEKTIHMDRLEGTINIMKNRLQAAKSSWYTDEDGNILFESATGKTAMMLCGEGFMIAPNKNADGTWNWRTFGTGEGFTADAIVAGYLSADRIEAGSITANKLAADVGSSLDLSSNKSIRLTVESTVGDIIAEDFGPAIENKIEEMVGWRVEIHSTKGDVLSQFIGETVLRARVWKGNNEMTDSLPASAFTWKRQSSDETADKAWEEAHVGMKEIALNTRDVLYSATYSCEITIEE